MKILILVLALFLMGCSQRYLVTVEEVDEVFYERLYGLEIASVDTIEVKKLTMYKDGKVIGFWDDNDR